MSHHPETIARAVSRIREATGLVPRIAIVLGSGFNHLENAVQEAVKIPYADIPGFPVPVVPGHQGHLMMGWLEGVVVAVLSGRAHFYEGHSPQAATFSIRVMRALGAESLIVTNAAGGLNTAWKTPALMLISDHINTPGFVGVNPLVGPNDDTLGTRFPDMHDAYDPEFRKLARETARELGIELMEGVYVMVVGPAYETPAEARFLAAGGADAVGMSTVPEVVVARHAGMRVLGISCLTNSSIASDSIDHVEVLTSVKSKIADFERLIRGVIPRMVA